MDKAFFRMECNRFEQIAKQYGSLCQERFAELLKEVVTFKFGVGGECMHRGFYCPSLISDIVLGNINRGRVYNMSPKLFSPSYIYGFSGENKLLTVQNIDNTKQNEFIMQQDEMELGITFSDRWGIETLSQCQYSQEKIQSYSFCSYSELTALVYELNTEIYDYDKDRLIVHWYQYMPAQRKPNRVSEVLYHNVINFSVENNILKSYTIETYVNGLRAPQSNPNRIYDVRLKRKITKQKTGST